jgi:hypothetical protein
VDSQLLINRARNTPLGRIRRKLEVLGHDQAGARHAHASSEAVDGGDALGMPLPNQRHAIFACRLSLVACTPASSIPGC